MVRSALDIEWPRTQPVPVPGLPMCPPQEQQVDQGLDSGDRRPGCWVRPHRPAADQPLGLGYDATGPFNVRPRKARSRLDRRPRRRLQIPP